MNDHVFRPFSEKNEKLLVTNINSDMVIRVRTQSDTIPRTKFANVQDHVYLYVEALFAKGVHKHA